MKRSRDYGGSGKSLGASREAICERCGKVVKAHATTFYLQWLLHLRWHKRHDAEHRAKELSHG